MIGMLASEMIDRVSGVVKSIDQFEFERFIKAIISSERIFVTGAGRSGLVGKSFAMRLMHLGLDVYVVGETTTPSIKSGDLLVAITGSGKTLTIVNIIRTAKACGARACCITSYPDSPAGRISDFTVRIGGRLENGNGDYDAKQLKGRHAPLTPLGTLFELSASIFLDCSIPKLMDVLGKKEDEMKERHTNLE